MTERRPIDKITVGKRIREDVGDVPAFVASIERVGLVQPIAITPDNELICGFRRLTACKRAGLTHVPVVVLNLPEAERILAEVEENQQRKNFSPSEAVKAKRRIEPALRVLAQARMRSGRPYAESAEGLKGAVREQVAAVIHGYSHDSLAKAEAVVEAAEAEPERFGPLAAEMDRTGKVNAAHRELRRIEDEKRILGLARIQGKFKTLVVDPPWKYDMDFVGRGRPDYACMTQEELLKLPVADWAEDNCHLYLWTTNAMFPDAIELTARWGFRHNTVLTWRKPKFGLGTHFRGQTEHVIFGIRGTLATRATNISTLFEGPVGAHSEKPETFYEIVRAASYPPYGEAFQRKERPDFSNLYVAGDEVPVPLGAAS